MVEGTSFLDLFTSKDSPISQIEQACLASIRRVVQFQDCEVTPFHPGHFSYLVYAMPNEACSSLTAVLPLALPFISQGVEMQESVFVHCDRGVSRSGSLIVAYLMASRGLLYEDALREARVGRACISPSR
jgi:protein-tyrosine phosphatase